MRAHGYRLPAAILLAAVAAGSSTLLLRPRSGLVEPAAATAGDYFTAEELERARDFRGPQRALGYTNLALSAGALTLIALRPPRRVRRALERAARRPLVGSAAAGAAIAVGIAGVGLPLSAVAHQRAVDVGLSTQDWGPWLGDVGKATAIGAVMYGGVAVMAVGVVRRWPERWWVPGSVLVVAAATALVFLSPVVIDPVFNKFERLPPGQLRADVLRLAGQAGVDVGEVYRVDASRRTTGANAYVWGLGGTKRVVLYDNLIDDYPDDQVRSVVAHELSHVTHRDVPRGLLWLAIVAPAGVLLVKVAAEALARTRPLPGNAMALPALALSTSLVSLALASAGNVLSRDVERRADAFALELTQDPAAFIGLEQRLTRSNVGDPEPPALVQALFGTHPTTMERIGIGLAWARAQRE